jgi:hypothetical protein
VNQSGRLLAKKLSEGGYMGLNATALIWGSNLVLAQQFNSNGGVSSDVVNSQITTGLVARANVNGGMEAILTWVIPLALALGIMVYLFIRRPWKQRTGPA